MKAEIEKIRRMRHAEPRRALGNPFNFRWHVEYPGNPNPGVQHEVPLKHLSGFKL